MDISRLLKMLQDHHIDAWIDAGRLMAVEVYTAEVDGVWKAHSTTVELPQSIQAVREFLGY